MLPSKLQKLLEYKWNNEEASIDLLNYRLGCCVIFTIEEVSRECYSLWLSENKTCLEINGKFYIIL